MSTMIHVPRDTGYNFTNGTCYENYDPDSSKTVNFLVVNPGDLTCPTPAKFLSYLVGYLLLEYGITMAFSMIRRYAPINKWYAQVAKKPRRPYGPLIFGSILLRILFAVVAGYTIAGEDPNSTASTIVMVWFTRPLPSLGLLLVSLVNHDPTEGYELALVDLLFLLMSVAAYGSLANAMDGVWAINQSCTATQVVNTYFVPMIQGGSAVGLLACLLTTFFFVAYLLHSFNRFPTRLRGIEDMLWIDWFRTWRRTHAIMAGLHSLHFAASMLLWAGLLNGFSTSFCPSNHVLGLLAGVIIGGTIVDNVWKCVALLWIIGDDETCPPLLLMPGIWIDRASAFLSEVFSGDPDPRDARSRN